MAVIFKQKPKVPKSLTKGPMAKISQEELLKAKLVDAVEYLGPLYDKMAHQKALYDEARKEYEGNLKPWMDTINDNWKPDESHSIDSTHFLAQVSMQPNTTDITSMVKIMSMLEDIQPGLFLKLARISITDLRKYLTPDQLEEVTETYRKGRRTINFIPKG